MEIKLNNVSFDNFKTYNFLISVSYNNPRFYIIGVFDEENLCAVSSLDYKCGKLIGKVEFPKECNTENSSSFFAAAL